ncbi:hypothetical protein C8R45DRAFT_1183617 [Mycena sanguinolenta]|nr:hypothetical protein C8R45DRAFT_1183617 [Mycena sanguinolenta]
MFFKAVSALLLVNVLPVSTSPVAPIEARQSCVQSYTVVSGDTCPAIESKTGVSDSQLHALNPSINSGCTNLQTGEVLCLSANGCRTTYNVVSGDTCPVIESKTRVTDSQLHALNPSIDSGCTNLQTGQVLCLSGSGCGTTYTVLGGDTCPAIESKTGASGSQLHALNPSINNDCTNLQIGEVLCITPSGCRTIYTVLSGETCAAIESKTGVSDSRLHALNPTINSDCTNLQTDEVLCLIDSACTTTYTVLSGDTCPGIESKTGISDSQLRALNPSINSGCTMAAPIFKSTKSSASSETVKVNSGIIIIRELVPMQHLSRETTEAPCDGYFIYRMLNLDFGVEYDTEGDQPPSFIRNSLAITRANSLQIYGKQSLQT